MTVLWSCLYRKQRSLTSPVGGEVKEEMYVVDYGVACRKQATHAMSMSLDPDTASEISSCRHERFANFH
jgi:hypothetical protein